ncbi:MAG: NADH-quinone oxidoreductase subunit C [Planctomycetes bacterium]|nr:NADH-quinone oxidoreductase subunit C [Planctomycetota bacterium]
MDFQAIHDRLRAVAAPGLVSADLPRKPDPKVKKDKGRAGDPFVLVEAQRLVEFLEVCRDDDRLKFEQLIDLSATDPAKDDAQLWINVQLLSLKFRHRLAIKCLLPKAAPSMPSTVPVYRASQWHERECAEMFGITFVGHPDPRNILLPDDWVGSPMRKDYEFPKEYHGISCE